MLEAYYGVVLFERRGRDITLTKTGEHLSGLVHRMFDVGAEIDDYLRSIETENTTILRIGSDSPYSVSDVMARSCQADMAQTLTLSTGVAEEIEQHLLKGHLDVALLVRVSNDPRLLVTPLKRHTICVCVCAEHPWAKRRGVAVQQEARLEAVLKIYVPIKTTT